MLLLSTAESGVHSLARASSLPPITGLYAEKRVTQVCIIQTTLLQDRPELNAVKGDVTICSGTLISPTQVLTAGHCLITPQQTTVTCSCGESDHQKSVEYSVNGPGLTHPDYDENSTNLQNGNLQKVDAQIVNLGSKVENHCSGPGVAPMGFIASLEETQKQLNAGHCYLAGWGMDNGQSSALHAAQTPRGFQIDSFQIQKSKIDQKATSVNVATFYNDAYRARFSAEQDRVKEKLAADGGSPAAQQALFDAQMKEYDRVVSYMSGDRNRHNAIRQGDSGGALFCTDDSGKDLLAGIMHSEWQEVVLISSPAVKSWFNQNQIKN